MVVAGGAWGAYEWLVASHYEDTDNAYVQGNVIQITPQIGGTVMAIRADDTDFVKAGQPLVQLDPADAKVALEQAEAALAQAVRQVRTLYANNGSLAAQVTLRQADIVKRAERHRARPGRPEAPPGAVRQRRGVEGRTEPLRDRAGQRQERSWPRPQAGVLSAARAAGQQPVADRRHQRRASTPACWPPPPRCARPTWPRSASRMPAPVDGYVAKRTVQLGQRVAAGTPMMSIVPLNQLWVDANFKEVQLRNIRIGQPVKLTADVYGKKVEYNGKVAGLGVGTGAAFALLPAQNATGNWIKVVQRVPVRIALDPEQLKANPLRVGLSMDAEVDVSNKDGKTLADAPRAAALIADRRSTARSTTAPKPRCSASSPPTWAREPASATAAARRRAPGASPSRRASTARLGHASDRRADRRAARTMSHAYRSRLRRPPPLEGSARVWGTIALSAATFMNVLDSSIANVSLPAIAGDLGVSSTQGTWVITSFAVANAIAVPLTGWLTQRFGQVRLFMASVAAVHHQLAGCAAWRPT